MRMSGERGSDADLVREALRGSREALAELLRRHFPTAVFVATRMLGSPDLARDAAQEAAIAAMTDLSRLRSPDRFGAWFCGITLNVARRWRRELRAELLVLPTDVVSPSPGPAEEAELADIAARVRGAVAALPYGQRNAVLLFYLRGLSHREVAAELGISVGAVKARLHQARASMAPRLASVADLEEEATMTTEDAQWIDVSVSAIRRSHGDEDEWQRKFVMVLAERDGAGTLPIWIGPAEAISLAMELQSAETPRPFTYTLAAGLVGAAGAQVAEVRITCLIEEVFYAAVLVEGPAGRREVDARPSDAVNLALAAGAPVKVKAELLRAGQAAKWAGELGSLPVATAEIAAEAQQRIRERRWHVCGPGTADPAT